VPRDKRERFITLAEKRTNAALKKIHLITKLANRHNYEYKMKEVEQIYNTLDQELKLMRKKFLLWDENFYGEIVFKLKEEHDGTKDLHDEVHSGNSREAADGRS
jgi:hypothetical protein